MMFDFKGRTVFVTGGSRGIGRAIAEQFLASGATVIVSGQDPSQSWGSREKKLKYIPVNFLDAADMSRFLGALERGSRIDILVNNAGRHYPQAIHQITDEVWAGLFLLNVTTPMRLMRTLVPKMRKKGWGRIVNISSIAGLVSKPGSGAYSASKAALIALTRSVALDVAADGILVNALCPGHTQTNMTQTLLNENQRQSLMLAIPLGRFATTEEIARFVLFLASPWNTYITGQAVVVDGGVTCQ